MIIDLQKIQQLTDSAINNSSLTATSCQYVPASEIAELDRLWASGRGSRQLAIDAI